MNVTLKVRSGKSPSQFAFQQEQINYMDSSPFSMDLFHQLVVRCDLGAEAFNPLPEFNGMRDETLLQYYREGTLPQKGAAFIALYNRNLDSIVRFVRSITESEEVAEEIFSRMWVVAITKLSDFDLTKGSFKNWLCGIARLKHLEYLREHPPTVSLDEITNEQMLSYLEQELDPDSASPATPRTEQLIENADALVHRLLKELKSHNPIAFEVIKRAYFQEQNSSEIGLALNKKPAAIRKILERALNRLREIAKNYDNPIQTR